MVKLEITKQGQQSCHLFEYFILNNKAILNDAFAVSDLKKVYLAISFSVLYFAVRWYSYSWKGPNKYFAQN